MTPDRETHLRQLYESLRELTDGQIGWVQTVVEQFHKPASFNRAPDSDLINACVLQDFGDALRIHHCFSREAFSKDKFEYAFERVLKLCQIPADLAHRGNPGHDIIINGVRFSLKTEAAERISKNIVHISKFMELGKGPWPATEENFIGLRARFFRHLNSYERILTLRRLRRTNAYTWHYELVEIPKNLLLEARNGELRIMHNSTQELKPAYYDIKDSNGVRKFQLYFDAGGERKLQIKGLKKTLCQVHAEWLFETGISENDPSLTLF
jgi:Type II site-specific deoxyribonuclease